MERWCDSEEVEGQCDSEKVEGQCDSEWWRDGVTVKGGETV